MGLLKGVFVTGLVFLSTLTSVNILSCISMNNQECKVRPQIVNVNGDDPVFFPFSIKTSKCSGSCNNINNPLAKLCVTDVVKKLNVKVFNIVSGTNETRCIEWHETCKCKCRFEHSVCNNKQRWNDDKCWCECEELIDRGVSDKGFVSNSSNCEWECHKSCDFSQYLDYKNCNCKKSLVNKLVGECTENIEEKMLIEITSAENENKHKRSSWTLCIVLFSIFFTINVGIDNYFLCLCLLFLWYLKMLFLLSLVPVLKQQLNELINGKSKKNRNKKLFLLFLQRHDQSQKFQIKLVKNRQKSLQRHWYLLYWIHYN